MSSIQEYCKKLSDDQIMAVINQYLDSNDSFLTKVALDLLQILVDRHPIQKDVHAAWEEFVKYYMPEDVKKQFYPDMVDKTT